MFIYTWIYSSLAFLSARNHFWRCLIAIGKAGRVCLAVEETMGAFQLCGSCRKPKRRKRKSGWRKSKVCKSKENQIKRKDRPPFAIYKRRPRSFDIYRWTSTRSFYSGQILLPALRLPCLYVCVCAISQTLLLLPAIVERIYWSSRQWDDVPFIFNVYIYMFIYYMYIEIYGRHQRRMSIHSLFSIGEAEPRAEWANILSPKCAWHVPISFFLAFSLVDSLAFIKRSLLFGQLIPPRCTNG